MSDLLKFEESVKIGDTIRAYDFQPIPDRSNRFIEGLVTDVGFVNGAKCFVVECSKDTNFPEPELTRVGCEVWVPMELLFDYDNRIIVLN